MELLQLLLRYFTAGWGTLCKSLSSSFKQAGFDIKEGTHPIVPIMLFDAELAGEMAQKLLQRGVYLTAFSYPVVPKGQARIRVRMLFLNCCSASVCLTV